MIHLRQPEKHEYISTGPVDDLEMLDTSTPCPGCAQPLDFVPIQRGWCHSGKHATAVVMDHYWCRDCADVWIEA